MTRSNRLLVVGGIVTLLGAALVLAVLLLQRPDPVAAPAADVEAAAADDADVVLAQDGASTAPAALAVDEGFEAVAVTVDFQRSVAALPTAGDRVNVYGRAEGSGPITRLLEDVLVLTTTGAEHASNAGSPTVVVAVPEDEVGDTLAAHVTEAVYLTLLPEEPADEADDDAQALGRGTP